MPDSYVIGLAYLVKIRLGPLVPSGYAVAIFGMRRLPYLSPPPVGRHASSMPENLSKRFKRSFYIFYD